MVFRIAWRGVFRNRRRAIVTIAAMGFAGAIMVFYAALLDGYIVAMKRNALAMELGEIQIHAKGYRKDPDLYKRVANADAVVTKLENNGFKASARVYGFALAAADKSSAGIQIRGIDVARERAVTDIDEHLFAGEWVDETVTNGAVLGRKLARSLGVKVGDEVVVLGQAADGSMANEIFIVRGILKVVADSIDRSGFFVPKKVARELLVIDSGAHEIAIVSAIRVDDLESAVARVDKIAPGHETASWRTLQPVLARMMDLSGASTMFMLLITYAAVAMVVLNATLMSVFERIREFGIMKALGVSPGQIAMVVFLESVLQATVASAFALALGVPVSLYYQKVGIDLRSLGGEASIAGIAMEPVWRTSVSASSVATPVVVLFVIVMLAVLYPGLKAALIRPLEAIYDR